MAQPDLSGSEFLVPTDPEKLIPWLEKKRLSGKGRVPDMTLRQNLAFTIGHQWIVWDARSGRFKRPAVHRGDPNAPVRITANKIAGLVEKTIAKLTKAAPTPEARPVSDSETDIDASKVATRILDHELYRMKWDSWLTEFWFWPTILGWSYGYVWWDPKAGDTVGQDGQGTLTKGEICIEEVPAFELGVDPNGKDMEDARWAVRTTSMSREAVWEKWGKIPEGADGGRSLADEVYGMTDDASSSPANRSGNTPTEFIKVHQLWMRPGSRANPAGMVVSWSGNTILEGPVPYPYKHGRLPFIQGDLLPGLGTREGRTWVSDLIPLQIDYNDARSREATIRRTLTPKIISPVGAIDPRRVTSRVEIIDYSPTGAPPQFMIPDSGWMAQFEAGMQRADGEMGERAGQTDVSGGRESASMPAAAILALQEADDTRLAISAKELAEFIRDVGWHVLQLVRQFWTEERLVRTWSDEGDLEVQKFSGADVSEGLDVHVSSESSLPKSKAARAQLTLELVDRGILTDPRLIVRMLDIPGADFLSDSMNKDARKAHRENGELLRGQQVPVAPFDNHMVHLQEHTDEMKEAWYDEAPPEDPRRVAYDAHVAAHHEIVLGQLGMPTPPGTPQVTGPGSAAGGPPGQGGPAYLSPMTGMPPNPTEVASGQTPSALTLGPANIRQQAGIGGPGQPGQVPGMHPDDQAAHMGR